MKYIVTNARGEPLKLGGFQFAVEAVAVPTTLEDASRFESVPAAELEAKRMLKLNGFSVRTLAAARPAMTMSKEHECGPYEACMVRFEGITSKLNEMHADFNILSTKVSNGMSAKTFELEGHLKHLKDERAQRIKFFAWVQTISVGVMIFITTAVIVYAVKHYNQHVAPIPINKP